MTQNNESDLHQSEKEPGSSDASEVEEHGFIADSANAVSTYTFLVSKAEEQPTLSTGTTSASSVLNKDVAITLLPSGDINISRGKSAHKAVTQSAREKIDEFATPAQARQVNEILNKVDDLLEGYSEFLFPEIHIAKAEDEMIGLSWNLNDTLLGISIQPETSESSWFLLSGRQDKAVKAYGIIDELGYETLFEWLVPLIEKIHIRLHSKK